MMNRSDVVVLVTQMPYLRGPLNEIQPPFRCLVAQLDQLPIEFNGSRKDLQGCFGTPWTPPWLIRREMAGSRSQNLSNQHYVSFAAGVSHRILL